MTTKQERLSIDGRVRDGLDSLRTRIFVFQINTVKAARSFLFFGGLGRRGNDWN